MTLRSAEEMAESITVSHEDCNYEHCGIVTFAEFAEAVQREAIEAAIAEIDASPAGIFGWPYVAGEATRFKAAIRALLPAKDGTP